MNYVKEHKRLQALIESHGLTYERGRKHYEIRKGGQYVATVSHSPSDMHFARQAVRDLVRKGLLPDSVKAVKF